ncbi:MAG: pilus assembly protein PilM [Planctomycetota bacterium]|jgi:type IV pilus assembly protein PilM|nr:pilus assembly protein PilM [Planctomycetota bacterium]
MSKAVGIDLGSRFIRVCQVAGSPKKFQVVQFAEKEVPSSIGDTPEPEILTQTIENLFNEGSFRRDRVVVGLPAEQCIFREFYLPYTERDKIDKVVRFEAEKYIPGHAIEELVIDYYVIAQEEKRSKILVVACESHRLRGILEMLGRCDIDPIAIDVDIASLIGIAQTLNQLDKVKGTQILLDFGPRAMKIALVKDGRLVQLRTPRLGTLSLEESSDAAGGMDISSLTDEFDLAEVDLEQFDLQSLEKDLIISVSSLEEDLPKDAAETDQASSPKEPEIPPAEKRLKAFLIKAFQQIQRTLITQKTAGKPSRIILTGGGPAREDLLEFLAEKFDIETVPLEILPSVNHNLEPGLYEDLEGSLPIPLGTALKGLSPGNSKVDPIGFDLRQGEFRLTNFFERIREGLAFTFFLVFLLFFVLAFQAKRRTEAYSSVYADYLENGRYFLEQYTDETLSGLQNRYPTHLVMQRMRDQILSRFSEIEGEERPEIQSALVSWRDVFKLILAEKKKRRLDTLRFIRIEIEPQKLGDDETQIIEASIVVETEAPSSGDDIKQAINKHRPYMRAYANQAEQLPSGKWRSTLDITLTPSQSPENLAKEEEDGS